MNALRLQPLKQGLVNLPGSTPHSAALTAKLLHKSFETHHCFFNDEFFHDHLSHHILSLYDLGASAEAIQKTYDFHSSYLRPLFHGNKEQKVGRVTEANWHETLGETRADLYADYLSFFSERIAKDGVRAVLEKYLFTPEANGNGILMLTRFFGGVLHPIIQVGYGVEFGQDYIVAQGLSLTAITSPQGSVVMEPAGLSDIPATTNSSPESPGPTLLTLLHEFSTDPSLTFIPFPGPFNGGASFAGLIKWVRDHPAHGTRIRALFAKWRFAFTPEDFERKVDECMWAAALILGGTTPAARLSAGKGPRMDFFLMHVLTSALTLRPLIRVLESPVAQGAAADGSRTSARLFARYITARRGLGVPRLGFCLRLKKTSASESESLAGLAEVDGTLFIRVAGALCDALGWPLYGGKNEEKAWSFDGFWEGSWGDFEKE
ncbi:hypothetical protein MKEN_00550100 [Mycena kentingensis (nom. inval.)]|nr:hypothetical protein MKEN_00550100 [Mycena kentingensis (nom. inval.)]